MAKAVPSVPPRRPQVILPITATFMACFLSGAMTCLSAAVIPVLLDTNTQTSQLVKQWARLYHYGHIEMPALCVGATSIFFYVARKETATTWTRYSAAAIVTITMVPFTWIFMAPTNDKLFGMAATGSEEAVSLDLCMGRNLLIRWAWLHALRSVFPMIGSVMGFIAIVEDLTL